MNLRDRVKQTATVTSTSVITLTSGAAAGGHHTFYAGFQIPTVAQKAGLVIWPDVPVLIERENGSWGIHRATLQRDGANALTLTLNAQTSSSVFNAATRVFDIYGLTAAESVTVSVTPSHTSLGKIKVRGVNALTTFDLGDRDINLRNDAVDSAILGPNGEIAIGTDAWSGASGVFTSGARAIAIGNNAIANWNTGTDGVAIGSFAKADESFATAIGGKGVFANHAASFNTGLCDATIFTTKRLDQVRASGVLSLITADATQTKIGVIDPTTNAQLANSTNVYCDSGITVVRGELIAMDTNIVAKRWKLEFAIKTVAGYATTALFGTLTKTVVNNDAGAAAWDCTVTTANATNSFSIEAIGAAATNIVWLFNYDADYNSVW